MSAPIAAEPKPEAATPEQMAEIRDRVSRAREQCGWGVGYDEDCGILLALIDQQAARISELEMINDCQGMHLHAAREHITALETERGGLTAFAASVVQEGAGRLD